jgi:hypothetical protein
VQLEGGGIVRSRLIDRRKLMVPGMQREPRCRGLSVLVALFAVTSPVATIGAQSARSSSCTLEVLRTDTLRLADGRDVFLSPEVADTAMGRTMVAGWGAMLLPSRASLDDSVTYMETAKRYPRVMGFVVDDRGIAEPVPLMPGMKEYGVVRLGSAGVRGWDVVATESLDSMGVPGDDTVRLRYGRWDGRAWRDVEDLGIDHGRAYLNMGRRVLPRAGDTVAFAHVRNRGTWHDDIVIGRRVGAGPWTFESWHEPRGVSYVDLTWDASGRQVLLFVQPDPPVGGRDRGSLFVRYRAGNRWGDARKILGGASESMFEPRLLLFGEREAIVWSGSPPGEGESLRAILRSSSNEAWDTTRTTFATGIYFLEVADGGTAGPLAFTRQLGDEVVFVASPFDPSGRTRLTRPAFMAFRPMVAPRRANTASLFRDDRFASDPRFPYVALRDVLRRHCSGP